MTIELKVKAVKDVGEWKDIRRDRDRGGADVKQENVKSI
jgi:hypothetical protein